MDKQKIIIQLQAQGKSKEEIYNQLISEGWKIDEIEKGFKDQDLTKHKADLHKRTIFIVVTIGAVLIGAGIFSFIAANWQSIGAYFKIIIVLLAMMVFYLLGWYLREKSGLKRTGEAVLLLGGLTYGGAIFLTAQTFHVRANWPDGLILWMLGLIVMSLAIETYTQLYLAVILGFISLSGYLVVIFDPFLSDPFILTSSTLIIVTTITTFFIGWKIRQKIPVEQRKYY